jgi:hypothetical protein
MPIDKRRRDKIAGAVAAYNAAHRKPLLAPDATHLLTVMFAEADVYRRSMSRLVAETGGRTRVVARLLRILIDAGFLSKDPGRPGVVSTYRLHLPPRRP